MMDYKDRREIGIRNILYHRNAKDAFVMQWYLGFFFFNKGDVTALVHLNFRATCNIALHLKALAEV